MGVVWRAWKYLPLFIEGEPVDKTTESVREMYEQFPYPAGAVVNRVGSDAELILSYVNGNPQPRGKLQVLDAGCGRGLGLIGAAILQPEVQFHGIDLNRVALQEATAAVVGRGLKNVTFQECDLMTLAGLEVPDGGFDVIHSSGVLHHLTKPLDGLQKLRDLLTPNGVINLMVYGVYGRQPLFDVANAVEMLFAETVPLDQRLPVARTAAAVAGGQRLSGSVFADTAEVNDVELVDRLLNVNETSYDIPLLWALLEDASLRFVRWVEPADWDPTRLLPAGELLQRVLELPLKDQYHFIGLLFDRPGFEMIIARKECPSAVAPEVSEIETSRFRLNPEVVIGTEVRHTPAGLRTETLTFRLRLRQPVPVPKGAFATIIMYLKDRPGTHDGKDLLHFLEKAGVSVSDSMAVLQELL